MNTRTSEPASGRRTGRPGADLHLQVVDDVAELERWRDEWTAAVDADPDVNVFLSWPWVRTWWTHFGPGAELHVIVIRDADGVVAIAPLCRAIVGPRALGHRVLQRISHDSGDYGGIVLVRREAEAVARLVDHLVAQLGTVGAVVLTRLADDARFTRLLGDELARRQGAVQGLAVPLDEACLFTDVHAGFDLAKQAKKHKIRQRLRRLAEQHGDVMFASHNGDTLEEGLRRLVTLHDRRWERLDEPLQGVMAEPARRAFLLDAIRALDAEGKLRLLSLEVDGTPVAVELDFAAAHRLFLFKGAFDPEFAAFSPGQLLHHRVFEDGLAHGVEVFDLCRGDAPYKRRWTNGERHLATLTLTRPGIRGSLARAWLRVAGALARRLRTRTRSSSDESSAT